MLLPLMAAAAPSSGSILASRQTGDFPNTRPCSIAIAYENNEIVGGDPSSGAGKPSLSAILVGFTLLTCGTQV